MLVLATFAALVRNGRWRLALPAVVFAGAAFLAQRNIVMATIVLVPILASCMPEVGTLTARSRPNLGLAFSGFCAVAALFAGVIALSSPATSGLGSYPASALSWVDARGVDIGSVRTATQDTVGNLLEVLDGPRGEVFVDDRADMFPESVFRDEVSLIRGRPQWETILDRNHVELVIWARSKPLGSLLATDSGWRTVYTDTSWSVWCRRASRVCDRLGA